MLIPFFYQLRDGGLNTSITELLTLLEAMQKGVAAQSVDDFYYLSRACLVKDESLFDRFDRIFAAHFHGVEAAFRTLAEDLPDDWLRAPSYDLCYSAARSFSRLNQESLPQFTN